MLGELLHYLVSHHLADPLAVISLGEEPKGTG